MAGCGLTDLTIADRPDTQPPVIEFVTAQGHRFGLTPIVVGTASDYGRGLRTLGFSVNGGPEIALPISEPRQTLFEIRPEVGPGDHVLRVIATDAAGHSTDATLAFEYAPLGYRYDVEPLPLVGDSIQLIDRNEHSQILYSALIAGGRRHGLLWDSEQVESLGEVRALDLNNRGQVVGYELGKGAFVWEAGSFQFIPGSDIIATAINDRGIVAIWIQSGTGIWDRGELRKLPLSHPRGTQPQAINSAGHISGNGYAGTVDYMLVWRDSIPTILGGSRRASAPAINDAGFVVGFSKGRGPSPYSASLFAPDGSETRLGSLFPRPTPPDRWSTTGALEDVFPADLNEANTVVGRARLPSGELRGFIWDERRMVDLTELLHWQWVITDAIRVDEVGNILAYARKVGEDRDRPVLLMRKAMATR